MVLPQQQLQGSDEAAGRGVSSMMLLGDLPELLAGHHYLVEVTANARADPSKQQICQNSDERIR